jgi:Tfp pilus assembly protein PilF
MSEYDFKGAHTDFLKALGIDPTYATAHQWYGELLAVERKPDAALAELKLARQLDPLAPIIPHVMGWVLAQTDSTDEAYQYYQEALDIDPYFAVTIRNLIDINITTGQLEQARERALEFSSLTGADLTLELAVIDAIENPDLIEVAFEQLMQKKTLSSGVVGKSSYLMLLNKHELALDDLEKGLAEGDAYAVHMNRLEIYDPVRDNPRFQALLAKMNLWP